MEDVKVQICSVSKYSYTLRQSALTSQECTCLLFALDQLHSWNFLVITGMKVP